MFSLLVERCTIRVNYESNSVYIDFVGFELMPVLGGKARVVPSAECGIR